VFPDPGIWIAALGSPLQFDLRRDPYTSLITITQVIHPPFGGRSAGRCRPPCWTAGTA
jgi:hypothetical protein